MKQVLNLGCGNQDVPNRLFPSDEWKEIKVDVDNGECKRLDIPADIRDLNMIEDNSYDGVYVSHVLEHFDCRTRVECLKEWVRVLVPDGLMYVIVPRIDAEPVIEALREGNPDKVIYSSKAGDITATMLLYGQFYSGEYEVHRWGYTSSTLKSFLKEYIPDIVVEEQEFQLCAYGKKPKLKEANGSSVIINRTSGGS